MVASSLSVFSTKPGSCSSCEIKALSCAAAAGLFFAKAMVSMARAVSWVVNALVDATPISGPARVSSTKFDSLTMELSATLQMLSVARYFARQALRSAAKVSAVSPD
jgi:hypothetical protein